MALYRDFAAAPICCERVPVDMGDDVFYCEACGYTFALCLRCGTGLDECGPAWLEDGEIHYTDGAHGGCEVCRSGYEVA